MDKVRVYELARDLGITSPETIRLLKDKLQIRVKSASSTVEEDIAIKLKRLIRLEGTGTLSTPEPTDGKVLSAAKRRAEKARLAILQRKRVVMRDHDVLRARPPRAGGTAGRTDQ